MANIDVSDLLVDPDFVDPVSVISRTQAVDSYGANVITETTTLTTVGSIQPASAKTVQRVPEALRMEDLSSFWIKGPSAIITTAPSGGYPSILLYKGARYQVKSVGNWGNYGQGYCEGICVIEAPSGAAP